MYDTVAFDRGSQKGPGRGSAIEAVQGVWPGQNSVSAVTGIHAVSLKHAIT